MIHDSVKIGLKIVLNPGMLICCNCVDQYDTATEMTHHNNNNNRKTHRQIHSTSIKITHFKTEKL